MEALSRLAQLLVDGGVVDEYQARSAEGRMKTWGGTLVESLVTMNLATSQALSRFISKQTNCPIVQLTSINVSRELLRAVGQDFCERHCLIPMEVDQARRIISVAMADATDLAAVDEIRFRTNLRVKVVVAPVEQITKAIKMYYRGESPGKNGSSPMEGDGMLLDPQSSAFSPSDDTPVLEEERLLEISDMVPLENISELIHSLTERVTRLEGLLSQHIAVIKALTGLMVEKKVITKEEFLSRAKK